MPELDIEVDVCHIAQCKYCLQNIVWLTSRNGKKYAVNVVGTYTHHNRVTIRRNNFHDCPNRDRPQ